MRRRDYSSVGRLLATIALASACSEPATAPPHAATPSVAHIHSITITDLGTLPGGEYSIARAINANGQIVGQSSVMVAGLIEQHAFLWERGVMTDLGSLAGPAGESDATGIAPNGVVVGSSRMPNGRVHAVRWVHGVATDLGTLIGDSGSSRAHAVNQAGEIVGTTTAPPGRAIHAFVWRNSVMRDLGSLIGPQGASEALAISASGDVVGLSEASDGTAHPVLWTHGAIVDLGPPGIIWGQAEGINSSGQIIGYVAWDDGHTVTIESRLWTRDGSTDLDALGIGSAYGISPSGQIVGSARFGGAGAHAALWEHGVLLDLGTVEGGRSSVANAISTTGQVVGAVTTGAYETHAAIWTIK